MESGSAVIAEFDHRYCERARRQKAFGYRPISFRNLRSPEAIQSAGVQCFKVTICEADIARYGRKYVELMDTNSDPGAGLVRWQVNCYVSVTGKLRPRAASWFSRRIPMVPLVARSLGRNPDFHDLEFLSPRSVAWHEAREREASLRYWSLDFQERLPEDCRAPCFVGESDRVVFPGTYNPVP
jgi:hypothetical protein